MDTQQTIRQQLSAWLDGELEPQEATKLQERLKADPNLARELEELRKVRQLVAGLPREKAPAGLAERIMQQARQRRIQPAAGRVIRFSWGRLAAAAAVIVTVGVGIVIGLNLNIWTTPNQGSGPVAVNQPEKTDIAKDIDKLDGKLGNNKDRESRLEKESKPENILKRTELTDATKESQRGVNEKTSGKDESGNMKVAAVNKDAAPLSPKVSTKTTPDDAVAGKKGDMPRAGPEKAKTDLGSPTEELACASINDVRDSVRKLLTDNGATISTEKAEQYKNLNDKPSGTVAVNRPDTIIMQVAVTQEQYDSIRKGLDKIRTDQTIAIRNRAKSTELLAINKEAKAAAPIASAKPAEEQIAKADSTKKSAGEQAGSNLNIAPAGAAGRNYVPQPAAPAQKPDRSAEQDGQRAAAAPNETRQQDKQILQQTPGSGGSQSIRGTAAEGTAAGGGRAGAAPAAAQAGGSLKSQPTVQESTASATPKPETAAQAPAKSAAAGVYAASQPAFAGRQISDSGLASRPAAQQAVKVQQAQDQNSKVITLTIVLSPYQDQPPKAAVQADTNVEQNAKPQNSE